MPGRPPLSLKHTWKDTYKFEARTWPDIGDWQDVGGSNPGGAAQPVTAKLPNGKLVRFSTGPSVRRCNCP
jgi:hypothetical protein